MRKLNGKFISLLLAVVLLLSVMPMSTFAADTPISVGDEGELMDAVLNGGEITLTQDISLTTSLTVNKDTVLNLGSYSIDLSGSPDIEAAIIVSGACLTVNSDGNGKGVHYYGSGSTFRLYGADTATKLVINGGYHTANVSFVGYTASPSALIRSSYQTGNIKPQVVLNGGSYYCYEYKEQLQMGIDDGKIFLGDADFVIKAGRFRNNPQANVDKNSIFYKLSYEESYIVLAVDQTMSDAFKALLNDKNELVVKRYKPAKDESIDLLMESIAMEYGKYDMQGNEKEGNYLSFYRETYNYDEPSVYASLMSKDDKILETQKINICFEYDKAIKAEVDKIIVGMPKGTDMGDWVDPYYYSVTDLELVNYWLACKFDDGSDDEIFYYNTAQLINFSSEYKKYIGYKNFGMDPRMGDGYYFFTECAGVANFEYNEIVYAAEEVGARANHVIYVPDGVANTKEALLAAAQKRVDDYVGKGKVTLKYAGTLSEVILREHYENTEEEWSQWKPDATFEEWLNGPCCPAIDYNEEVSGVIENANKDTLCFKTTVKGNTSYLLIVSDSSKMTQPPKYQNVDISTDVSVESDDSSIPLDTLIEVEKLTKGEEYERIIKAVGEDGETFDIKLHSGIDDKYITKLENGKFQVKLPVPERFEGKNLIVYYVDAKGKVTEHAVTVKDGYAIFTTDHFSAYTLSVKDVKSPQTNDNGNMALWLSMLIMSLILLAGVYNFKKVR